MPGTEVPRIVFVQSDAEVAEGSVVEVVGTLAEFEIPTVAELEDEMFGDDGFDAEWEVVEGYHVANGTVEPVAQEIQLQRLNDPSER